MANNEDTNTLPPVPSVNPTAGWATSQGQMTAVFTLVCMVLALLGFHYTPDQFNDWVDRAEHTASVILPLFAAIVPVLGYINSRGKIASNALNANAAIKIAAVAPQLVGGTMGSQLLSSSEAIVPLMRDPMAFADGGIGGALGSLLGGTNWKDPERYENLLHVAGTLGVPGAAQADAVNQQVHPAQLIAGILGMFHKKK